MPFPLYLEKRFVGRRYQGLYDLFIEKKQRYDADILAILWIYILKGSAWAC